MPLSPHMYHQQELRAFCAIAPRTSHGHNCIKSLVGAPFLCASITLVGTTVCPSVAGHRKSNVFKQDFTCRAILWIDLPVVVCQNAAPFDSFPRRRELPSPMMAVFTDKDQVKLCNPCTRFAWLRRFRARYHCLICPNLSGNRR